ncbi:MAG: hypothetical protein C0448_06915 [Sphingobacteriaceae bacterium]|nr:hypothetical protein [Sphingobacteriaceae bacterium]
MWYKLMIIALVGVVLSCKKKEYEKCDHAYVCVTNTSSSKLPYSWGGSQLNDTLRPGETACKDAGYLDTDPQNHSYSMVYFMTPNKSTAITPTSCNMQQDVP